MSREAAGLYLHVPFCSAICPYCDFAVLRGDETRRRAYVQCLLDEIASWQDRFEEIDTVYFGGGTPSLLTTDQLAAILRALRSSLSLCSDTFKTIELNPEDASPEKLSELRALGFEMVSLGVQSLDTASLSYLGRRHSPSDARQAVLDARAAGFEIVSLDLIYGLPDQSPRDWICQLAAACELRPDHISCYQLTIEPATSFGKRAKRGELRELSESRQADLFLATHRYLDDRGFSAYEVSNFARSEHHRSPHNQKYWRHTPYLGLGPSAHSLRGSRRWWNHRHLETWMRELTHARAAIASYEDLSNEQLALEFLMLGLRQPTGVDLGEFRRRFDCDLLESNRRRIDEFERDDLLRQHGDRLVPSLRGLAIAEGLAASLSLPSSLSRTR